MTLDWTLIDALNLEGFFYLFYFLVFALTFLFQFCYYQLCCFHNVQYRQFPHSSKRMKTLVFGTLIRHEDQQFFQELKVVLFSVVGLQQLGKHILHGYDFMVGGVVFLDALDARELVVSFDASK